MVSVKLPSMKAMASDRAAATSSTMMIGSRNLSASSLHTESSFGGVMTLSPCCRLLSATSFGDKPRGL